MLKSLVNLAAAAAIAVTAGPALAQIQTIDPNQADSYEPSTDSTYQEPGYDTVESSDWAPIDESNASDQPAASDAYSAPLTSPTGQDSTVPRDDVFSAAEGVFGRGAEGLAGLIERILSEQGDPVAYISGQEAGGAFVFGVRYGSGTMRHQVEGDRAVYWTGPSLGFDFGADANKVFVLVYNLHDSQDLFKRYPGAEGHAYVLGGFTAQYLRRGDVVLIPIRMGVGLRLGVNAGYMRFSERNRWLPF